MSAIVDRMVSHKIMASDPEELAPGPYSTSAPHALAAVDQFTNEMGGTISMHKRKRDAWNVVAMRHGNAPRCEAYGKLPAALCRAMLQAVGVTVTSSDDG